MLSHALLQQAAERANRYLEGLTTRSVAPTAEALRGLAELDSDFPDAPMDPGAVLALLDLAAREQGLLLLIEDIHWIDASTLAPYFRHIHIVAEKDVATYRRILSRHAIDPSTFLMVGNSVRSDVLPVIQAGGRAVHIPHTVTWAHEVAEHDGTVPTLRSITELPAWLDQNA